jgi:hypothetical protein
MAQEPHIPSEAERKVFVEKLGQFRSTLQPKEQAMLDGMAMAAFHDQDADVEGYQWFYGGYYAAPVWYQSGWATQWYATPWGYSYRTVPASVWYP